MRWRGEKSGSMGRTNRKVISRSTKKSGTTRGMREDKRGKRDRRKDLGSPNLLSIVITTMSR